MGDFLKNLDPAVAGLLAAGIGVVGVVVGAYLSKSVQARNIEADRKADVYAQVWRWLQLQVEISEDLFKVGRRNLTERQTLEALYKRADALAPELRALQELVDMDQGIDPEEERRMIERVEALERKANEAHAAIAPIHKNVKDTGKAVRRLEEQSKKNEILLEELRPALFLTGSRLCVHRYYELRRSLASHDYSDTSAADIQNVLNTNRKALDLWTLTARRDTRATRRGGWRLLVFVFRSAWVRMP